MITVMYTRLGEVPLSSLLDQAQESFPHPDCAEYIDALAKKSNTDSARESLAAIILLGRAAEWMGIDTAELIIERSPSGKPFFSGAQTEFSLTHSKGYIAAALSDEGEVGIDIEASEYNAEKARRIAERYFSDEERKEFSASPNSFLRIWTKKEARVKLLGAALADHLAGEYKGKAYYRYFEVDGYPLTLCTHKAAESVTFGEERL